MKAIKQFFILFAVFFASISIPSCTENDSVADIDLGEIPLEIPIFFDTSENTTLATTNDDNFRPFVGKINGLNLKDSTFFAGITEFYNLPKQISIKNVRIQIKKEGNLKGSKVKGFTTTTYNDFNGNVIAAYEKGEKVIDFIDTEFFTDSKLTNYVKNIFTALEEDKTVNIEISGVTDIEADEEGIQIGIINILVEVSANIELK